MGSTIFLVKQNTSFNLIFIGWLAVREEVQLQSLR